jgi:hypothetical protein
MSMFFHDSPTIQENTERILRTVQELSEVPKGWRHRKERRRIQKDLEIYQEAQRTYLMYPDLVRSLDRLRKFRADEGRKLYVTEGDVLVCEHCAPDDREVLPPHLQIHGPVSHGQCYWCGFVLHSDGTWYDPEDTSLHTKE